MQAQPKHQTTGNPHKDKPEKNKLLEFHSSQNHFLFVDGWGEVVHFQQMLPALRHLYLLFFPLSTVKLDSLSELFFRYQNTVCNPPEQTTVSPLTPNESSFCRRNPVTL